MCKNSASHSLGLFLLPGLHRGPLGLRAQVRQNQQRLLHDLAMPLMGFWLVGTVVCGLVTFVLFILLLVRARGGAPPCSWTS